MSSGWVKYITGIRRGHVNKDFWTGFRSISHRLNRSQVLMAMDGLFACILTWSARSIGSSSSGGNAGESYIFEWEQTASSLSSQGRQWIVFILGENLSSRCLANASAFSFGVRVHL
ncbi:uncharacterized protein LOC123258172 [Drosophila ananassae]|uniref:uncharacterized protein LOC123258172 n=1 Tax=Drosophila ananassae TaxID=7217 RepID=UPI001CFF87FA|nr:uncharacterized protein LOC123258172 [Drosophila ananassae]